MTKLYSWNVNGLRACMEKGFREFLEREQPDVAFIDICMPGMKGMEIAEDAASSGGF